MVSDPGGDVGQLRNLEPSEVQPTVDSTTALLSGAGVSVTGTSRVPATYMLGGLRLNLPTRSRVSPAAKRVMAASLSVPRMRP